MRHHLLLVFALVLAVVVAPLGLVAAADREGRPDLSGRWKLVDGSPGGTELALLDIKDTDGKLSAEVVDSFMPSPGTKAYAVRSGEAVVVVVSFGQGDLEFKGLLPAEGRDGRASGVAQLRVAIAPLPFTWIKPSRLERAGAADTLKRQPEGQDPTPEAGSVLAALQQRRALVAELGNKRYAPLDLRAAVEADRDLPPDAPTESRAWATRRLVESARRAGVPDPAAEARWDRIKALINEETRDPTVSGDVTPFQGRQEPGQDRVVLLELFTGTGCGACVASDMACDALERAYGPAELIVLEYHVHIPRADPLTNPDSVARQNFYGVRSAPSTFFNGRAMAGHGGTKADARRKFHQFRGVVDDRLRDKARATIDLSAARVGDEVRISAAAEVLGLPDVDNPVRPARLQLALVEDEVRYDGGNGLAAHHHVVRAMPGGVKGSLMVGGRGRAEEVVRLDVIRKSLNNYLDGYPARPDSRGPFPGPLPAIEFGGLHAVAFIQSEDNDVLHAVTVPVRTVGPGPGGRP